MDGYLLSLTTASFTVKINPFHKKEGDTVTDYEKDLSLVRLIAEKVKEKGGRCYFVGGYVRDALMKTENKDIDMEVHGVTSDVLEKILDSIGGRMSMGESFGIYALKGHNIDIAMPRKERVKGRGHRDFDVFTDPFLGTEKAAQRRDFTVNALMQDVLTGEITDHFGGIEDLQKGILRHVNSESFCEDPLRVLRGAQFSARFGFSLAEETVSLCKTIDLSFLSKERVYGEMLKALLKAERPAVFFEVLRQTDALSVWFGELQKLIGVEQNPRYHPEGDVWTHTMMVLDVAAKYRDNVNCPEGYMLTALCHDFGKAICTEEVNGAIHAYAHETLGLPLIENFICRITNNKQIKKYVLNMSALHMRPNKMADMNSAVKKTNKMFDECVAPVDLVYIAAADNEGKGGTGELVSNTTFLLGRLDVYNETMSRPYVMGKDLIEAGLVPDSNFSEILSYAHKLRLAGIEKQSALKQTLAYARKMSVGVASSK